MAGRIKDEDVALVKERASIEDIVREHVTLTRAGPGRLKGLCPFHDEKTASFNVRPAHGHWHCFGCGEGGDVISFLMKIDHLTFVEAVARLAEKVGVELHLAEGDAAHEAGHGRRQRLLEAHRVAEEFYHEALLRSPEARAGRDFLRERGFDSAAATRFGIGFAPRPGEALTAFLRGKGFGEEELVLAGLSGRGRRGLYDRFRGRLVWPIRDITGSTVGFGARRLYDDDRIEAKYLNTAETPIYKKTSLLYGLDLARRRIASARRAIVVEGYTDVMACHLAGIEEAVATCGTAFGPEHVATLRRVLRDDDQGTPARTVFTFDGDAAGQKAAMRAFALDQSWASQTYVAVAADGQDPCDLRRNSGDAAVRLLVDDAVPTFEFAMRTIVARHDLTTAEGRVHAMRAVAPVLAGIRDRTLRGQYQPMVAGWIGVDVEHLADLVARAPHESRPDHAATRPEPPTRPAPATSEGGALLPAPDLRDPIINLEHQLLQVLVQHPVCVDDGDAAALAAIAMRAPAHGAVLHAILSEWGRHRELSAAGWVDAVADRAGEAAAAVISELSVAAIHARVDPSTGTPDQRYVDSLVVRVREVSLKDRIAEATGALRRAEAQDPERSHAIALELTRLQRDLRALQERLA